MSSPISEPCNISAPTMPSKSLGICCFFRLPTGSSADGISVSPHHCSNATVIPAFPRFDASIISQIFPGLKSPAQIRPVFLIFRDSGRNPHCHRFVPY